MSARDLILFALLGALCIMSVRRPFIGALGWVLFGVMNPHRLTWGPAFNFPFSTVIAAVTLIGLVIGRDKRSLKGGLAVAVLVAFLAWNTVTTFFAFHPVLANEYLSRVSKTFLMTLVLCLLLHTRKDVLQLVAVLVGSLAFYGTKGGAFVIATGGNYMVNGPPNSPVDGNNSLGVGLTMIIPLLYFLMQQTQRKWLRRGLVLAMCLCAASVLGSYSRGAMLAIGAMGILLWFRSHNKLTLLGVALAFLLAAIPAMPDQWFERMETMRSYQEDASAQGRLVAWQTATNIAVDKFPLAGGFEWEGPDSSLRYSPNVNVVLVAHSIYFQVLGSQGFIGLGLFLLFWWLVWRQCAWIRKRTRRQEHLQWAYLLASMVQVSLVGYAVGGAFLDLAFWDFPYYMFAAVVGARYAVAQALAEPAAGGAPLPAAAAPGQALPPGRADALPAAQARLGADLSAGRSRT